MSPELANRVCAHWGHEWFARTHIGGRRTAAGAVQCQRCWVVMDECELWEPDYIPDWMRSKEEYIPDWMRSKEET